MERDVAVHPESGQERDRKNDQKSRNIGRNRHDTVDMDDSLIEHEVVQQEVQRQVESHVQASAGGVAERLRGNDPAQRLDIEQIDQSGQRHFFCMLFCFSCSAYIWSR